MTASIFISHSVRTRTLQNPSKASLSIPVTTIRLLSSHFTASVSSGYYSGQRYAANSCGRRQFEMIGALWHGFWILINRWTRSPATVRWTTVIKQCSVDLCWENFPEDQMIFFFQSSFSFQCCWAKVNLYLQVSCTQQIEATRSVVNCCCCPYSSWGN